ncbi:MAG: cupin domain-containing protein [bacterium]
MHHFRSTRLGRVNAFFRVLGTTTRSQVATMRLRPGQDSGEYGNEHPRSDQVLYVLAGRGLVIVSGKRVQLSTGDTVIVEAGEKHQFTNTGRKVFKAITFYAPPAY